jgi:hypothetical protein
MGCERWYFGSMRRVVVLAMLGLLLVAGGWLVLGGGTPTEDARTVARKPVEEEVRERPGDGPRTEERASKRMASKRTASKQERELMRKKIVEAMQAREGSSADDGERAPTEDGGGGGASPPTRRGSGAELPDEAEPEPGNLTDRTGNHGYLMKVMNEDLMPLADECYALARETEPELAGVLVIDVEIIGDEEIGGVIETAAPGLANELTDPALIECVRESLLSTTLPPPPEGGKDAISLSLRLSPDEEG